MVTKEKESSIELRLIARAGRVQRAIQVLDVAARISSIQITIAVLATWPTLTIELGIWCGATASDHFRAGRQIVVRVNAIPGLDGLLVGLFELVADALVQHFQSVALGVGEQRVERLGVVQLLGLGLGRLLLAAGLLVLDVLAVLVVGRRRVLAVAVRVGLGELVVSDLLAGLNVPGRLDTVGRSALLNGHRSVPLYHYRPLLNRHRSVHQHWPCHMNYLRTHYDPLSWHKHWPHHWHIHIARYVNWLLLFGLFGHQKNWLHGLFAIVQLQISQLVLNCLNDVFFHFF
ncbi:hypothetical protein BpHYR1_000223 [Brachionus plicatilis]|uniref:Uncharacterized protein n=1 Tax=Brachionus plicatilis TaxID=10195 RepID=A0A3M7QN81_BRAPC|nr:hypothetical protein BpHYR1_000223 [Brachionus plicatilis]